MRNKRIVSILLILVSLAALLLLPAQVLAGNPAYTADAVYNLAAAPKPISDPSKAVPDSTAYLNKADPRSPIYDPKIQLEKREPTAPLGSKLQYDHLYWGSFIRPNVAITGVYAGQSVRPTLDLPPVPMGGLATVLYAPTLELNNCCPVESVTRYKRDPGASSTMRQWCVYNHITGTFPVVKDVDAQFLSNYVRYWEGPGQQYFTEIGYWYGTYYVLLYNFNTGQWEIPYTTSGTGPASRGWDIWEIYKSGAWPALPDIQVSVIRVYVNGDWPLLSPTYGYGEDGSGDMPYTKFWMSQYDAWYVGP